MADELTKKRAVRKGQRSIVDKRIAEVDEALAEEGGPDRVAVGRLKMSIEEKLVVIKKLDEDIVGLLDNDEAIIAEIEDSDEYCQAAYERLVRLDSCLSTPVKGSSGVASSSSSGSHSKLPQLDLPAFNGDLTKWTAFWDLYEVAVHKNSQLSDVERFTYLRTLVTRGAKDTISGLALTSANYKEAVKLLTDRFGNKDRIIAKHMEALLNVQPVMRNNDSQALRALHDKIETHVRELKALGVSGEAYNLLLPSVVIKNLPSELRLTVSRKLPEGDWSLDNLMKELNEELSARERSMAESRKIEDSSVRRWRPPTPTAANLFTNTQTCCYCDGGHLSELCRKVSDTESRKHALRVANRCFNCLKQGHISRTCRRNSRCCHCGGYHHVSICYKREPNKSSSASKREETAPGKEEKKILDPNAEPFKRVGLKDATSLFTEDESSILLQTAKAMCYNSKKKEVKSVLRFAFDSGSQRSYITEEACQKLKLSPVGTSTLRITAFGDTEGKRVSCGIVKVGVNTRLPKDRIISLFTVPSICDSINGVSLEHTVQPYKQLRDLELADSIFDGEIINLDVLIGLDHYWDFMSGEIIKIEGGPTAVFSSLGWIISGPVVASTTTLVTHVLTTVSKPVKLGAGLEQQLKRFWELEAFGVVDKEEDYMFNQFQSNVVFNGERYEVSLPWRDTARFLPDNYQICIRRLNSLLRRLKDQPIVFADYDKAIKDQIDQGIVEVVNNPSEIEGDRVHYLPHHAVIRHDKDTTKLRVVYDASARGEGASLNDCLFVGPKFNQHLFELLLRFRVDKYAFIADIEKAFLMIAVAQRDRDVLRFLWVKDINQPHEIQVLRFTRVTFGVAASPFLLNATVKHHIETYRRTKPDVVKKLSHSMYVDDVVSGASSRKEAEELYEEYRLILSSGGFNLRKFTCSGDNKETDQKVLGVLWNTSADCLKLDLSKAMEGVNESYVTKRMIVSRASKVFDPIGLATPVTIKIKLLFQKLHCAGLKWDDIVKGELLEEWLELVRMLKKGILISVPRCYNRDVSESREFILQGFCDASKMAYAAVVYLQCCTEESKRAIFVTSKSRVAPVSKCTIPRLELLGALLLARLMRSVKEGLCGSLSIVEQQCYTDSQIVLYWILGENKDWKPFVQNRVQEIRRLVAAKHWGYCKGRENPADLSTRGITVKELSNNNLWFNGPSWLSEEMVVSRELPEEIPQECIVEMLATERRAFCFVASTRSPTLVVDIERYSCLDKLYRVTGMIFRFIAAVCKKSEVSRKFELGIVEGELRIECLWARESQRELVKESKFVEWKRQFQLFEDEYGIWRCGGRLEHAFLKNCTKFPIIIPGKHHFTELVIRKAHERVLHNGVKETLAEVRSKYWIIKGRAIVKKFISRCIVCKKAEGLSYGRPPPPPLPTFRVKEEPPFTFTGVDFAGPLYVKDSVKSESKTWICLFTCCVSRAIHLELVTNLSVESFLRGFRRFIARRGLPRKVLSDNAKTFKKAATIIKDLVNHPEAVRYFKNACVQWIFNLERAPWWGGVFERLIRSVKRCLRKVIGRSKLTYEELLTVLTEVEMVINSRPLTYMYPDDLEEPITPSHLLIGRRVLTLPDSFGQEDKDEDYSITPQILTKRMKHITRLMDQFWNRWKKEYLLELRDSQRYHNGGIVRHTVKVGDIVIIHDDFKKRGLWDLGRIEETINGEDGHIRGAIVRVCSGPRKAKRLRRSVVHLYPLEIRDTSTDLVVNANVVQPEDNQSTNHPNEHSEEIIKEVLPTEESNPCTSTQDTNVNRRSKRSAAVAARDRIYLQSRSC